MSVLEDISQVVHTLGFAGSLGVMFGIMMWVLTGCEDGTYGLAKYTWKCMLCSLLGAITVFLVRWLLVINLDISV